MEKYYSDILYLKASKLDSCSASANLIVCTPNKNLRALSIGRRIHISLPVLTHHMFFIEVTVSENFSNLQLFTDFTHKLFFSLFCSQDWYFWMPYCSLCLIILFVVVFGLGPGEYCIPKK